jgi:antitoxin (DNA-binding transcriptional repressor) of toxin-antitoxin stability system
VIITRHGRPIAELKAIAESDLTVEQPDGMPQLPSEESRRS